MKYHGKNNVLSSLPPRTLRPQRRRQLARNVRCLAGWCVLIVFATAMVAAARESSFFYLYNLQIQGAHKLTTAEIAAAAGIIRNRSIFSFDLEEMRQRLERHPWIKSASVQRSWPGTVTITISEERPVAVAVWQRGHDQDLYYVNDAGERFVKAGSLGLDFPVITFAASAPTDVQAQKEEVRKAVQVLMRIDASTSQILPLGSISQMHLTGDGRCQIHLVDQNFPIEFDMENFKKNHSRLVVVLRDLQKNMELEQTAAILVDFNDNEILVKRKVPLAS